MVLTLSVPYKVQDRISEKQTYFSDEVLQSLMEADRFSAIGFGIDDFIHSLNNHLTGISGSVQMIQMDFLEKIQYIIKDFPESEKHRKKCAERLNNITEICDRMHELIRVFYDIKQLLANEHITIIDVNKIIKHEIAFFETHSFYKNKVKRTIQITPDKLPVKAQPALLSQLFYHILINAVDAVSKIPEPRIIITTERDGTSAVVTITDNGIGIPKAEADYIFEPRVLGAKKNDTLAVWRQKKRRGLGLYFCSNIIKAHNGDIEVKSAENAGSTIRIVLPLSE